MRKSPKGKTNCPIYFQLAGCNGDLITNILNEVVCGWLKLITTHTRLGQYT